MFKTIQTVVIGAMAATVLFGCSRTESPAEVRSGTTEAQREGTENVVAANQDRAENRSDAQSQDMQDSRDVAIAKAEADHKVQIQQCEGLAAGAQDACKEAADAKLDMARKQADGTPAR